jgi:hypothetical protein
VVVKKSFYNTIKHIVDNTVLYLHRGGFASVEIPHGIIRHKGTIDERYGVMGADQ